MLLALPLPPDVKVLRAMSLSWSSGEGIDTKRFERRETGITASWRPGF